jgi:DNA-binding CsgD family transcriptional regulator
MTEQELREALQLLRRRGQISRPLLLDLVRVARTLVTNLKLPDYLSPYGRWDIEIVDDLVADWIEQRLLRDGRLLGMLDMAFTPAAFRGLAGDNLYQHVMSTRARSQSQNIWKRLTSMLEKDTQTFALALDATKRANRFFTLTENPSTVLFSGSERELRDAAYAAGEIELLLWSPAADRLSPLIGTRELKRFVIVIMRTIREALTPVQLMTALNARLDLAPDGAGGLDDAVVAGDQQHAVDAIAIDSLARSLLGAMTSRQRQVLRAVDDEEPAKDTAERLGVSPATITNDRTRIGDLVAATAEGAEERGRILDRVIELLDDDDHANTQR